MYAQTTYVEGCEPLPAELVDFVHVTWLGDLVIGPRSTVNKGMFSANEDGSRGSVPCTLIDFVLIFFSLSSSSDCFSPGHTSKNFGLRSGYFFFKIVLVCLWPCRYSGGRQCACQ